MASFTVIKVDSIHQLLYFYLVAVSLITANNCVSKTVFYNSFLAGVCILVLNLVQHELFPFAATW